MRNPAVLLVMASAWACGGTAGSSDPAPTEAEVREIRATVDSLIRQLGAASSAVDADAVLAPAVGEDSLTILVGDVMLSGYDAILTRFRDSYANLQKQEQTLVEQRIRVLSRDVAIGLVTAQGTYTDKAGWTSDPVGIGLTLVFVRHAGQWRLTHAHESFIE